MHQPYWRYQTHAPVVRRAVRSRKLAESVVVLTAVLGSESVEMSVTPDFITHGRMASRSAMLLRENLREKKLRMQLSLGRKLSLTL